LVSKQLLSGKGWRIGWFPYTQPFSGLVGGDNWAFELTQVELEEFCTLALQLITSLEQAQSELSEQESLTCTAETENICLEVMGYPDDFRLSLQLHTGRRAEGAWDNDSLDELVDAIIKITESFAFV
jgi:Domain of unknown function (DUF1818)